MSVDPTQMRNVMGNFATGVTVATLPTDPPHGMTANAVSSVSLDPPLVLVCVDHDTTCYEHLSGDVDEYCLNVLAEEQLHLGEYFAGMAELDESPFETEATRTEATGAPVFEDAIAYLDCTVDAAHPAGDHTIYVGRVESADILDPDATALTFFRGEWGSLDA
jgi:flavin reductase (DIM6/NTAB) family NADH-FMN oxidoreductase RutF